MGLLDSIPWDQLIPIIIKLMGNCRTTSEGELVQEVRRPGIFTRWKLRHEAREEGITLTAEQWDEVYQRGATASQLEIQTLVRQSWGAF